MSGEYGSPKFTLGQLVATPAAIETMATFGINPHELLSRHLLGDWGEVDASDKAANDEAVANGEARIISAYGHGDRTLWVITDADRSATTILRPEDY